MVTVRTRRGTYKTLLNPSEKAGKYAGELRTGIRKTNEGRYKADKNGDVGLTKVQRSYRAGYLDARKDNAKAYNANKKKKAMRRKSSKDRKR